jgi:hypothetical protein
MRRGMLHTSTAPLPMRYTTMGYTSMRYTSTALYFYKQITQAPNKFFRDISSKKDVNKCFKHLLLKRFLSKYSDLVNISSKTKKG